MSQDTGLEAKVLSTLFEYGKLGLLVEDAADAGLRTARELYAADGLPAWWLQIDNLTQAAPALSAAVAAVGPSGPEWARGLPLVVLLDRYIKVGGTDGAGRIVPWDRAERGQPEPVVSAWMREAVAGLENECGRRKSCVFEKITSYQDESSGRTWKPRHHEPLFHLRSRLAAGDPELLAYGPVAAAPVLRWDPVPAEIDLSPRPGEPAAADRRRYSACRARLWRSSLTELAAALHQREPERRACILFTGAGASLANHRLAPGIPPTWFLLEWACWSVCADRGFLDPLERPEPTWPAPYKPRREIQVESLAHLIELYRDGRHSVVELDWEPLENLFQPFEGKYDDLRDFSQAFRHVLLRYDHGFPYHSWLLAQLPWTLVVTTNFDGFHERATGSAVSAGSAFSNDPLRRLGDLLDLETQESGWTGPQTFEALRDGPGLLKPYGSLTTMGPLTLALDDFWGRTKPMQRCFDLIRDSCEECWLVVVGHGLAYPAIEGALVRLEETKRCALRVLWVDPMSCHLATRRVDVSFRRRFRPAVNGAAPPVIPGEPARRYDPIPSRALDFAYDLWQEYERQRRAREARPGAVPG